MNYSYNDLNEINNKKIKNILLYVLLSTPVLLLGFYLSLGNFVSLAFLIINYIVLKTYFINKINLYDSEDFYNVFILKKYNFYTLATLITVLILFNFLYIGYFLWGLFFIINLKKIKNIWKNEKKIITISFMLLSFNLYLSDSKNVESFFNNKVNNFISKINESKNIENLIREDLIEYIDYR